MPFNICYSAKNPDPRYLTVRPPPHFEYILTDRMVSLRDCSQEDFGGASLLSVVTAAVSEEQNQKSGFPHTLSDHNPFMEIRTRP